MFDFLKGGKVDCEITLDREKYYPGETVQAGIRLASSKDMKIQKGVVRLVCRQEYKVNRTQRQTDSDGDSSLTTREVVQQFESVIQEQVFIEAGTLPGGAAQAVQFSAAIPLQTPPSWPWGNLVHTAWVVKVTLDRKLAVDFNSEKEFTLVVAPDHQAESGEGGQVNKPQEMDMGLFLPAWEGYLGEALQGELRLSPYKTVDVNEVRIELVREEVTLPSQQAGGNLLNKAVGMMQTGDKGKQASETVKVKLAGKTRLTEGQSQSFPFTLQVPANKPCTWSTDSATVSWKLRGVLDRGLLHGDYTVEQVIPIYNGKAKA